MSHNTPEVKTTNDDTTIVGLLKTMVEQNKQIIAENAELRKAVEGEPSSVVTAVKGAAAGTYYGLKAGFRSTISKTRELGANIAEAAATEAMRSEIERQVIERHNQEIDAELKRILG